LRFWSLLKLVLLSPICLALVVSVRRPLVVLAKVLLAVKVMLRLRSPMMVFWWLLPDKKEEAAGEELLRLYEELA
ncbi:hypothetical protein CI238_05021, partial [Colletotrichum incanum]